VLAKPSGDLERHCSYRTFELADVSALRLIIPIKTNWLSASHRGIKQFIYQWIGASLASII
jgi:hypothetical protein